MSHVFIAIEVITILTIFTKCAIICYVNPLRFNAI